MKFMLILKANKDSEAGTMPSQESINTMVKYNQEQAKAGILLDAAGLYPSSTGANQCFGCRKENSRRWTIHRIEGTDRRPLDHPGEVDRRSDRVGEARSEYAGSRDRDRSATRY